MKVQLSSIGLIVSEKNMFKHLRGLQYEGIRWPLKLINSHCLIRFNLSSENNDFGSIQIFPHLNALGSQFRGSVVADLFIVTPIVGFCNCSMFCCTLFMSLLVLQSS